MDSLTISLMLDLTTKAPEGPGWYLYAYNNEGYLIKGISISPTAAYEASRALQEAMQSTEGELPQIALPQIAESGSTLLREALNEALRHAEEQANKVDLLRRKLNSLPPPGTQ